MKLIAKKPCSFGGKRFYIGDEIPGEFVLSPNDQEKMGVLAIVNDDAGAAAPGTTDPAEPGGENTVFHVVVHAKEGDLPLSLNGESLQAVVDVMTSNADGAAALIKQMTDRDALALLYFADSRKTVQQAAEARARAVDEANAAAEPEEESETAEPEEESAGEQ